RPDPGRGGDSGAPVGQGPADHRGQAPGVDLRSAHRERVDAVVRVGIPRRGGSGRYVQRRDAVARLTTDGGEAAGDVDRGAIDRNRVHLAARVRIPGGGGPGSGIECGEEAPSLATDGREEAARVNGAS